MKRFQLAVATVVGSLAGFAPTAAEAQVPGPRPVITPIPRPAVSPYLNLLRRGQSTALNYYNLVLPEVTFQRNISDLQQVATTNQRSITQLEDTTGALPETGHHASFMSHTRYFMNGAGYGMGAGGGRPTMSTPSPSSTSRSPSPLSGATSRGVPSVPSRGR